MIAADLALVTAIFFDLALALTLQGLVWLSPHQGARVGIPTSAVLLGIAALFMAGWDGLNLGVVAYFLVIGLVFPVCATPLSGSPFYSWP